LAPCWPSILVEVVGPQLGDRQVSCVRARLAQLFWFFLELQANRERPGCAEMGLICPPMRHVFPWAPFAVAGPRAVGLVLQVSDCGVSAAARAVMVVLASADAGDRPCFSLLCHPLVRRWLPKPAWPFLGGFFVSANWSVTPSVLVRHAGLVLYSPW